MAAPTLTARVTPSGVPMKDGYQSLITFEDDTNIELWEKGVTPPGLDGGDEIDASTMHNSTWRTFFPRSLKTMTNATARCAYQTDMYTSIVAQINVEQTITITFSDGKAIAFFGFLKRMTPDEMVEGEQPEAEVEIVCTNWDPDNNVEEGPTVGSAP